VVPLAAVRALWALTATSRVLARGRRGRPLAGARHRVVVYKWSLSWFTIGLNTVLPPAACDIYSRHRSIRAVHGPAVSGRLWL